MNREKVQQLRDRLAQTEERFWNMNLWMFPVNEWNEDETKFNQCGTAACLAGHTCLMEGHGMATLTSACVPTASDWHCTEEKMGRKSVPGAAACVLGFEDHEAEWAFSGGWSFARMSASLPEAIDYLDRVLETGRVRVRSLWNKERAKAHLND